MSSPTLTFKQYLDSKDVLREAAQVTPKRTAEYNVNKYCNLAIGESKQDKQLVALKPKQKLFIDWLYEDVTNPTPLSIRISGADDVPQDQSFQSHWRGERLMRWLDRNANEQS